MPVRSLRGLAGAAVISGGQQLSFAIDARLDQSVELGAGAEPGTLADMVNLRKGEALGYMVKREAYRGTAAPPTLLGTVRGWDHKGASVRTDGITVQQYGGTGGDVWESLDLVPQFTLTGARLIAGDNAGNRRFGSCASGSGVTLHVWLLDGTDGNQHGVYAMAVADGVDGAVLRGPEKISASTDVPGGSANPMMVRVATDGTNFWIVWMSHTAAPQNSLRGVCVTASFLRGTAAWPAPTQFVTNVDTSTGTYVQGDFDMCVGNTAGSERLYIAYSVVNAGPAYGVNVIRVTTGMAIDAGPTAVTAVQSTTPAISTVVGGTGVWVGWNQNAAGTGADIRAAYLTNALVVSSAGATLMGGGVTATIGILYLGNTAWVVSSFTGPGTFKYPTGETWWCKADGSAATVALSGTVQETYGPHIESQPFISGSDVFVWASVGDARNTASYFSNKALAGLCLIPLTTGGGNTYTNSGGTFGEWHSVMPHMRVAAGRTKIGATVAMTNGSFVEKHAPPKVYKSSVGGAGNTSYFVWDGPTVAAQKFKNFSGGGTLTSVDSQGVTEYRFKGPNLGYSSAYVAASINGITVTSGGVQPFAFDGTRMFELGFTQAPEFVSSSASTVGGLILAGTYGYALVYEYTDANGLLHQSAPKLLSAPITTTGTTSSVTLNIYTLKVTAKQDRESNPAHGSLPASNCQIAIYRTTAGPSAVYYRIGSITNDPQQQSLSYTDTLADSDAGLGPILYTVSGELPNEMPSVATHMVRFGNRLAGIDAEDRERLFFSKPIIGNSAPAFSSALQTYVRGIGYLNALAELDGTLYAFSASAVAVAAYGTGQNATGAGEWPPAQIIDRGSGCSDPRHICTTPDGIVYCSSGTSRISVWLLPRGGGVPIEIGAKVRGYFDGTALSLPGSINGAPPVASGIVSCVNWAEQSRVVVVVQYADLTTRQLEYDYANKGQDGQGVWGCIESVADDSPYGVVSSWVSGGRHWLGALDGHVLQSTPGQYTDTLVTGGAASFVNTYVYTHKIKIGNLTPRFKLNFIHVDYGAQGTSVASLVAWQSSASSQATSWSVVGGSNVDAVIHRQWYPPFKRDDGGEGFRLAMLNVAGAPGTENTAGAQPRSVTVDVIPIKGVYRPQSSEVI